MSGTATRRARWIGLAAAAMLLAGCGATEPGSAEAGDPSMTSSTSSAEGTGDVSVTDPGTTSEQATEPDTTSETVTESTESAPPPNAGCSETGSWDAAAKKTDYSASGAIIGVTAESADCSDSVTIWIKPADAAPGYTVEYVPEVVMDGSGLPVPLTSPAKLQVIVTTPAYEDDGGKITPTFEPEDRDQLVDAKGLAVVQQVAYAGSFEGQTTFGIGVAAELPFTVTTDRADDGSTTLTVSVAHG